MNYDELYLRSYKLIQNESYQEGLNILLKIQDYSSDASFLLAYLYEIGVDNILDKNLEKSIQIYQKLIVLNEEKAFYNLGMLFLRDQKYIEAVSYLKESSLKGNCSASYWLYRIYSEYLLSEIDRNKYLEISKNQGHLQAEKEILIQKRNNIKGLKNLKINLEILIMKLKVIPIIFRDPNDPRLN